MRYVNVPNALIDTNIYLTKSLRAFNNHLISTQLISISQKTLKRDIAVSCWVEVFIALPQVSPPTATPDTALSEQTPTTLTKKLTSEPSTTPSSPLAPSSSSSSYSSYSSSSSTFSSSSSSSSYASSSSSSSSSSFSSPRWVHVDAFYNQCIDQPFTVETSIRGNVVSCQVE